MITPYEIILRLLLGALFGGAVGYERQVHGRPAGLRTHLITCVSSVLLMITSEYYHHLSLMNPDYVRVDPARIAAGAMTGVGFIGAGVILKLGASIQGLTTAASIWMVSAMGLALGAGLYLPTSVAFALTLFALLVLRAVEKKIPTLSVRYLTIAASGDVEEDSIRAALENTGASIRNVDYEKDLTTGSITFNLAVSIKSKAPVRGILDSLSGLRGIQKISIRGSA